MPDTTIESPHFYLEACRWVEHEDGYWDTACDKVFEVSEGGPRENHMLFCCYCGRPLVEVAHTWT